MALSDDQRAMLQLLLEGGQSYADIGALLGVDAAEVQKRARGSLTELGGSDPDAQVGLTDYLLGQADPIGRADVARHLQSDPGTGALAAKLAAQLRLIAPQAQLPNLPGSDIGGPPSAGSGASPSPGAVSAGAGTAARSALGGVGGAVRSLGGRDKRIPLAIGAAGLLVLAIVLAVASPFGGDDDSKTSTDAAGSPQEDLTIVELQPQGGSGASGQAVFARVQDQPVLQINLAGLQPTTADENYIVWLYNSDEIAFPIARDQVGKDGNLTGAAPIPQELTALLPQFQAIDVSLATNAETKKALQSAAQGQKLPSHSGTSVLRGEIPRDAASSLGEAGTTPTPTTPAPAP